MPQINNQSVREELDRLKSNFKSLLRSKKIAPEIYGLIKALFLLLELLVSIFLEKNTKKNTENSSKPPSQTEKDESALEQSSTHGKGKVENKERANNTRTVETTTLLPVAECDVCGADLEDEPCQCYERHTRIDIVFETRVEHFDAEVKVCPDCDSRVKAPHPAGLKSILQYGSGLKAFVIQLLVLQMLSLKRTQNMLKTLIGRMISEATLLSYVMRLHHALADWEQSAQQELLTMKAIHSDETSLRVDKKNQWIHVYSAGTITLKFLHKKRGKKAIEEIGIIPAYSGVVIHDCWASYLSYDHCRHGLCGSHLLRELTFIVEAHSYRWATNMKRLLQETCKRVSRSKKKKLSQKAYSRLQRRYRNILTRGAKELPAIPDKPSGRRGKMAKSDAHNLLERLQTYEEAVLLFARDPYVAFTNNRAERDLRMSKVKQKVSGCFRNEEYAKAYCRISSYLQTMANKGINPLIAVQMALAGDINS